MFRLIAVLACLALLSGACADDDDEPVAAGDDGRPAAGSFEPAGEYLSQEVTQQGAPRPLVADSRISLRFDDGTLGANAGCNSMSGRYTVDAGTLRVAELAMTEMGCEPPLMAQDRWLADLLMDAPTVEAVEDGFVLAGGDTTIRFVERAVAEPDLPLGGTRWLVTGFIEGEVAMSTAAEPPGTLVFEENGFVTGHDGCNGMGYGASPGEEPQGLEYDVAGARITFEGAAVTTDVACPGLEDDVERYHAVLSGTVEFEIVGSNLTIVARDGRGVTYVAGS